MIRTALPALLLVVLAACGGGDRQGVTVTEAEPVGAIAPPGPRPSAAFDTVYADSGLYMDSSLDSLATDTLAADSTTAPRPAGPDFRTFWPRFQDAVRAGKPAVAALTHVGEGGLTRARFDEWAPALLEEPFREGVLSLTARDFRIRGVTRDVSVTVGYNADGAVVPEDEAVTESSLLLRFEPRDGAYRLVGLDVVG